jgi:hypothetical protein
MLGHATHRAADASERRKGVNFVDYFWLIPTALLGALLLWIFYAAITRETGSGERHDGKVLVDKPAEPFIPGPTIAEHLRLKRTDDPD